MNNKADAIWIIDTRIVPARHHLHPLIFAQFVIVASIFFSIVFLISSIVSYKGIRIPTLINHIIKWRFGVLRVNQHIGRFFFFGMRVKKWPSCFFCEINNRAEGEHVENHRYIIYFIYAEDDDWLAGRRP